MTSGRLAIIGIAAAFVLLGAARTPIYVGVLESPLDQTPQLPESQGFRLRVAFVFRDGRWSAMPHGADNPDELPKLLAKFPSQVSWTIALQGKRLGHLSSMRPLGCSEYAHIGLEDLAAGSKPPAIKEGAAAFATWAGPGRYRPLLAVSEPNYNDPDHWAPFDAPAAMRKQAVAAFRRAVTPDMDCDGKTPSGYSDSAIQVYGKSYRSIRGDVLIAMNLDRRLEPCEGPASDEWQSVWFHLKGDTFHWIGNSLTLLDIGDYNDDGTAKILLQYDGYDRDGYVLLDPRDDSKTEFSWIYH